jgi:methionyl aminopeptidase
MTDDLKQKAQAMREGGLIVRRIKTQLQEFAQVGRTFLQVEARAQQLISDAGAVPNFSLEPGYHWAICINKNAGMVHGIPDHQTINDGDLISIDLGILWRDFNLDTSISFVAGHSNPAQEKFLAAGKKALAKVIAAARSGNSVFDLSKAIEKTITAAGYQPSFQLTGHGVGRKLHEDPLIPCVATRSDKKIILFTGQTLALEVMYAAGNPYVILAADGWTYETADGSLSALFEDTVLITPTGPEVLT